MASVLRDADKANGYCFREMEERQLLSMIYSENKSENPS